MPRHFTVAFIQYRVNSIRGGHGGFGIVGNGDFGNSAEVFIGVSVGIEPVCQFHILISMNKGIGAGRQNGNKDIDLFNFSRFRVCIAKGLACPVNLDFLAALVLDMEGKLVLLLEIAIPFAKLGIHDAVWMFCFIFFP